jgi:hypothetical protein
MSLTMGQIPKFSACADPKGLVLHRSEEKWYNPMAFSTNVVGARWYIRPVFLDHWEILEGDSYEVGMFQIRWLCFARVEVGAVSLHWRGFSYADNKMLLAVATPNFLTVLTN